MALEREFRQMMVDTVTRRNRTATYNNYGEPTYTEDTDTFQGLVQWGTEMVQDTRGEEIVVSGTLYMDVTPTITADDELILPGDITRDVVSVELHRDERGDHHQQVRFS